MKWAVVLSAALQNCLQLKMKPTFQLKLVHIPWYNGGEILLLKIKMKRNILPHSRNLKNVPFHGHVKLWKIDSKGNDVGAFHFAHVTQINLQNKMKKTWFKKTLFSQSRQFLTFWSFCFLLSKVDRSKGRGTIYCLCLALQKPFRE